MLALRTQLGDTAAARELYKRCFPLRRIVFQGKGIPSVDQEELFEDAFMSCISPGKFAPSKGNFVPYLVTTLKNKARDRQRRASRQPETIFIDASEGQERDRIDHTIFEMFQVDDQSRLLRDAVYEVIDSWAGNSSASGHRGMWIEVISMRYFDGMSNGAIADRLDVSVRRVDNIMSRHVLPALEIKLAKYRPTRTGLGASAAAESDDRPDPFQR